ncbi:MAG TPA: flagellar export chaperone FliS, partial [Lachnospiraceae bacterium]|nr:flagellar export chaperone FliS [Lachnospiraceae bacterium]
IKFTNIAILAIEHKETEKAHINIMKTQRIIEEFRMTLNFDYPVAKDFDTVYSYLIKRLIQANMKKDKDILEEVLKHLRTMRDTWKEVMRRSHA